MTEREIHDEEKMAAIVSEKVVKQSGEKSDIAIIHKNLVSLYGACSGAIQLPGEEDKNTETASTRARVNSKNLPILLEALAKYQITLPELSGIEDLTPEEVVSTLCSLWLVLRSLRNKENFPTIDDTVRV